MTRWLIPVLAAALPACPGQVPSDARPDAPPRDEWDDKLAERVVDYSAALRIAALRLTGELPTLAEIKQVGNAPEGAARKAAYEAQIDRYLTGTSAIAGSRGSDHSNRPSFAGDGSTANRSLRSSR